MGIPFSHYENRQKFSTYPVFRALPSDVDEETQVQSAEENTLSIPETEKTIFVTKNKKTLDIASFPDDSIWIKSLSAKVQL